MDSRKGTNLS
jgi:hypothetical protein